MASRESLHFETTDAHELAESISRMARLDWVVVSLVITNPWKWWHWRWYRYRYEAEFAKQEEPVTDSLNFNFGPVSERIITQEPGPQGVRKHVSLNG